jgi:hypothetical protein
MNSPSSISGTQARDLDPSTWTAPPMMAGHEFGSEEDALRWCGLNELLFAVEADGIMELSVEPVL